MAVSKSLPTVDELLEAVQYALNAVPNTKLNGCPLGCKNSYALASVVDQFVYLRGGKAS